MPQKSGKNKGAPNKQEKSGTTAKKQKKATPAPEPQRTIGDSWELSVVNAKTTTAFQNSTGKSDFWEWFNRIDVCGLKSEKDSLYLMRKGIAPMWEDPKNIQGGQVRYIFVNQQIANEFFTELAVLTVGEVFQEKLIMIEPKKTIQVNGLCVIKQRNETYNFQIWYNFEPKPSTTTKVEDKEQTEEPEVYRTIKSIVTAKAPKIKEWIETFQIQTNFKLMGERVIKEHEQKAKSTKPFACGQTPKNDHRYKHKKHF